MKTELAGYGSVVLLDFLYFTNPNSIKLKIEYVNTCFSSQFSNKIVNTGDLNFKNLMPLQKDVLTKDFNKDFLKKAVDSKVDYILIDFINEHIPLVRLSSGAVLTYSKELRLSRFLENSEYKVIEPYSKESFEVWASCWDSFIKKSKANNLIDKVIINKIFWAKKTMLGNSFGSEYDQHHIYKNNVYLYQLYAYCSKDIPRQNFIEYDPSQFIACDKHRLGVTPFNFAKELYEDMALKLNSIVAS